MYSLTVLVQRIRKTLYYVLFKIVHLEEIEENKLGCWLIPNKDQEKLIKDDIDITDLYSEIIDNIKRKKMKFIYKLQQMYCLFKEKKQKLMNLNVLGNVFDKYQMFDNYVID